MFPYFLTPTHGLLSFFVFGLALFVIYRTYVYQLRHYNESGTLFGFYPLSKLIFFAPLYEEVIFRAIILSFVLALVPTLQAVMVTSLVFGLWHIKNSTYQPRFVTLWQVIYTGFVIGPVLAFVTIETGDIYTAILIHALNNWLAPAINTKLSHILRFFKLSPDKVKSRLK